jgi:hypothetical protein
MLSARSPAWRQPEGAGVRLPRKRDAQARVSAPTAEGDNRNACPGCKQGQEGLPGRQRPHFTECSKRQPRPHLARPGLRQRLASEATEAKAGSLLSACWTAAFTTSDAGALGTPPPGDRSPASWEGCWKLPDSRTTWQRPRCRPGTPAARRGWSPDRTLCLARHGHPSPDKAAVVKRSSTAPAPGHADSGR